MRNPKEFRIVEASLRERLDSDCVLPYVIQQFTGPPINAYFPVAGFMNREEAKAYKRGLKAASKDSLKQTKEHDENIK